MLTHKHNLETELVEGITLSANEDEIVCMNKPISYWRTSIQLHSLGPSMSFVLVTGCNAVLSTPMKHPF